MNQGDNNPQFSVLDLPQLHTKPSFISILNALSSLAIGIASWDVTSSDLACVNEEGIPAYLTGLVSSPLSWLASDAEREEIWEVASRRLSERSGRSAMSSFQRTFTIPTCRHAEDDSRSADIRIYEPALTGDQIGHKTWLGAYVLAKRLHVMLREHFPRLYHSIDSTLRILELGAGTGLAGLAAAIVSPANTCVHLTDLPEILPNLQANLERNANIIGPSKRISADVLDWSKLPSDLEERQKYDCILAADSLYGPEHPAMLTSAMAMFLKRNEEARIFTVLPFREMDRDYHAELRTEMATRSFRMLEEGMELGVEDWYTWKEREEVRCWWCVWVWKEEVLQGGKASGKAQAGRMLYNAQNTDGETGSGHQSISLEEKTTEKEREAWEELCRMIPEMLELW
ncbi:MAG: hypothetical protein Q9217_001727 [Psora testacea]